MHQQQVHNLGALAKVANLGNPGGDEVLQALRDFGLFDPDHQLRKALQFSLTHRSYVYENSSLFPDGIRGVFTPLQELGKSYQRKQAAVEIFRRQEVPNVGYLSAEVAQVSNVLQHWIAQHSWISSSCSLGRSLSRKSLPMRVVTDLFYQFLGVLCLAGEHAPAASLVSDLVSYSNQHSDIRDPKTTLQEKLRHPPIYEYHRSGPDHTPTFRATVISKDGRQGTGEGPSKKKASQEASEDFLRKYVPEIFRKQPEPEFATDSVEIPGDPSHSQMVSRLQDLFSLSAASRPLISQALIHSSWAYENRSRMNYCHQRDNSVLGYIGAQVLNYEFSLSCAKKSAEDPLQDLRLSSPPNQIVAEAFRYSGMAQGLLLGAGQSSLGIPVELGANTFQAVVGSVFVGKSFPAAMRPEWPLEWEAIWRMIVQESQERVDPSTQLAKIASAMKLHLDYEFTASGPDHAIRYKAIAVLDSRALGVKTTITGAAVAGKTHARQVVSQNILDLLEDLASEQPQKSLERRKGDVSLARFLLTHQASIISEQRLPVQRWIDFGLFGLHWISSPDRLLRWSQDADNLVTRVINFRSNMNKFERLFRHETISGSVNEMEPELTASLDSLEGVDDARYVSQEQLDLLVQLCNVYRCLGSRDPGISVGDLAADWKILYHNRLEIVQDLPSVILSGRDRAILDAAINTVAKSRPSKVVVEVANSEPLRLRFTTTNPLDRVILSRTCALWSRVSKTARLETIETGIEATIVAPSVPESPGPITKAALASLQQIALPYQAAVADLLHDLKNQLVAARLANSYAADTRTARLEQQLAASRHLDQAQALVVRLRATASLLQPVDAENAELGSFIRSYAATMLSRLPRHISLSVPDARHTAHVALSGHGLTAVLDNLVSNSIEALSEGGTIRLDWTADQNEAVIEVADSGPGIPKQVLDALASGERVRSTKPGGNGLGLLGVNSLLNSIGGELTLVPADSGTAWFITLPLSSELTQEDS